MTRVFNFRLWPDHKTERLKEMWWQGKAAADICRLLRATSPKAVQEKAAREGFVRDPRLLTPRASVLLPQPRGNGDLVTMRNCGAQECRWPYGPPGADMPMCGRSGAPYCAAHRALAYVGQKGAA